MRLVILKRRLWVLIVGLIVCQIQNAQELKCTVEINADQVENVSKNIFETLRNAISDYMNTQRWTDMSFSPNERIECKLFFTVNEYNNDKIIGTLQVQSSRPVFNSTYTTTLLNYRDNKIEFTYIEGDPLIFNEFGAADNLTALLNFYAFLILGIDFDTFSENGGQPWFDKASQIVQSAQSNGESGWRTFEDNRNRSALLNAYTDANLKKFRTFNYNYHRHGLDEMAISPEKARKNISSQLLILDEIYQLASMGMPLTLIRDSKIDEIIGLYSKATPAEKDQVYKILSKIYPTETERIEKIRQFN